MKNIIKNVVAVILVTNAILCFTIAGKKIVDSYNISSTNNDCFILIEKEGDVGHKRISEVKQQLKMIPEPIQTAFQKSGWNFIVTDRNLDAAYFEGKYGKVNGVTVSKEESIYIYDSFNGSHMAPIHEMGHWFDIQNNVISKTEDFLNIYEKEKQKLLKEFEVDISNEMEFFAEGFQCYLKHPKKLEKCTPLLYEYMEAELHSYVIKES